MFLLKSDGKKNSTPLSIALYIQGLHQSAAPAVMQCCATR